MSGTVTLLIPTFNRPRELQCALESAQAQTYADLRVLVIDNASDDETRRMVADRAAMDRRVSYYRHPSNIGMIANFAWGLGQVATDYFGFLPDDDLLLPSALQLGVESLVDAPQAMLSISGVVQRGLSGTLVVEPHPPAGVYAPPEGLAALARFGHPNLCGVLFRRSVIDAVGTLDASTGMLFDIDYHFRVAAQHPIVVRDECAGVFFIVGATKPIKWVRDWEAVISNLRSDEGLPREVVSDVSRELGRRLNHSLWRAGVLALAAADGKAIEDALRELKARGESRSAISLAALSALNRAFPSVRRLIPFIVRASHPIRHRGRPNGSAAARILDQLPSDLYSWRPQT